jgi:hypothetical protein
MADRPRPRAAAVSGRPDGGSPAPGLPDAGTRGLPDGDVRDLVERLDTLLAGIEQATGPVAKLAAETVEALVLVYGTALARVTALAGAAPGVLAALADDELLHHLLALHGVHPRPAGERIRRALDDLRPRLRGEEVELAGVDDGIARLRRSGGAGAGGCGRSAGAVQRAIGEAVLAAAPELRGVEFVPAPGRPPTTVIPVESLRRRPRPPTAGAATPAGTAAPGGTAAGPRDGPP